MKQKILLISVIIFSIVSITYTGTKGTTAASFLKISVGARNIAMGETGATSEDVNSIYWNPSGLASINNIETSLMHAVWLETINYEHLACGIPTKYGNLGFGINYLYMGEMDKYDNTGSKQEEKMTANDFALTVFYSRKILLKGKLPFLNLGVNLKYLMSKLDTDTTSSVATDIGLQTQLIRPKLRLGLVFQNIGTEMKFIKEGYPLPLNIKLGLGHTFLIKGNTLDLLLDVNIPNDNNVRINGGIEYGIDCGKKIKVFPRLGYGSYVEGMEDIYGITGGIGFTFRDYTIDYAFVPYGKLGNTHRISLIFKFR